MKNKKTIIGTMLFLFVISGFFNIVNVSAETAELPSASYWARGFEVDYQDKLEITVSSNGLINIYIMNEEQIDILTDSGGLTWNYIKRWKDMFYLEYTYTIPADGTYYIVLYNKNIFYGRTVDIQVDIDYYQEPYEPDDSYIISNLVFFIIILIAVIGAIIICCMIFKKDVPKEPIIQIREVPKGITYCSECGAVVLDKRKYCSNCGNKIILN